MSIVDQLRDFFKMLFSPTSPDVQKNQQLKASEVKLSKMNPPIYKHGSVQPIVGDALYAIHDNIGYFNTLLSFIQIPEQQLIKNRVYDTLLQTGYNEQTRQKAHALTYEMRKKTLDAAPIRDTEAANQAQAFLTLQKDWHMDGFMQIEKVIKNIELFYDLSCYNFVDILTHFNASFSSGGGTNFSAVPCAAITEDLLNFYYVSANVKITGAIARAITAISTIVPSGPSLSEDQILAKLKKIAASLNKIVNPEIVQDLIMLGKQDSNIKVEASTSQSSPIDDFAVRQKALFTSDTERLDMEHQDQEIIREIREIFGERSLTSVLAYNSQTNMELQSGTSFSFLWIMPIQLIKTFLSTFLDEQIQALLNDIVVEGFFTQQEKKSSFSSAVFECVEAPNVINEFENFFRRGEKYDNALILSYVKDSQKDPEFIRTLGTMVADINNDAKLVTQKLSTSIYDMYNLLLSVLEDSRLSTPELISNIKFLFTSSRNRETVDMLEKSMPRWGSFLKLMRHYAQLGSITISREEKRQT